MIELTERQLIKVARKIHGMTLKDMGSVMMCNAANVSYIERGINELTPIRREKIKDLTEEASKWYVDVIIALISRYERDKSEEWLRKTVRYLDVALGLQKGQKHINENSNRGNPSNK